ncbi:MAG: hypothetical protein ACM3S2_02330 [Ignavibacteriales bacterium]
MEEFICSLKTAAKSEPVPDTLTPGMSEPDCSDIGFGCIKGLNFPFVFNGTDTMGAFFHIKYCFFFLRRGMDKIDHCLTACTLYYV